MRVGPGVVEAVGVDLRRGPAGDLAEPLPGALVEAAVADDDVGDAGRDRHRRLLDGRAGRAAAVVDPAEEPQVAHAQLARQRDLGGGVHRERRQAVDVAGRQPASASAARVASTESWSSERPDSLENSVAPMPAIAALPREASRDHRP